jgi:hypothetical protein
MIRSLYRRYQQITRICHSHLDSLILDDNSKQSYITGIGSMIMIHKLIDYEKIQNIILRTFIEGGQKYIMQI